MNKLSSTAKKLDTFFKILSTFLSIGAVTSLVGLAIIGAGFLFDLDPEMIGTGYNSINFGSLDLTIAEAYAPDPKLVLVILAIRCVIALVICLIVRLSVKCVRRILAPMILGEPFSSTVSADVKKLAKYALIQGIAVGALQAVTSILLICSYDMTGLLLSDKITQVTFNESIDLTFLLVAAVLWLLSYIFRYGEELQRLSDETL